MASEELPSGTPPKKSTSCSSRSHPIPLTLAWGICVTRMAMNSNRGSFGDLRSA
jgi:hypothetical protein